MGSLLFTPAVNGKLERLLKTYDMSYYFSTAIHCYLKADLQTKFTYQIVFRIISFLSPSTE